MVLIQGTFRRSLVVLLLAALSLTMIGATSASAFPDVIHLPNGWRPEGIASGTGTIFYVGSVATGAVYQGDLRTGDGHVLVPPQTGRSAAGLKYDVRSDLLYVAGASTGHAYVYNAETGATVVDIPLTTSPNFINDVAITRDAVYFTNSSQAVLYRVPLSNNGDLPLPPKVEEISLSGDYQLIANAFNANGIVATPNGKTLIIVNTAVGALYNVDQETGVATRIDLGGGAVFNGDGLWLQGKTLYVVENFSNQIAVVRLSSDFLSGTIVDTITDPGVFGVPTTIAEFGSALYAVNSHFDIMSPTPDTPYEVVRVPRNQ